MRILLVSPEFPPKIGGIGRSTVRLAQSFAKADCTSIILTYDRTQDIHAVPYTRIDYLAHPRIQVLKVGPIASKRAGVDTSVKAALKRQFVHQALRELEEDPPDIVLSLGLVDAGFLGLAIATSLAVPHVVSARGADVGTEIFQGDKFPLAQTVVSRSAATTFVNSYLLAIASGVFGTSERFLVIKNGVSQPDKSSMTRKREIRQELRDKLRIPRCAKLLGWSGTFREKKGLRVLDLAFRELIDRNKDVYLLIVGGPRSEEDGELLSSLGAQDKYGERCRCVGLVDRPEDVLPYYLAMDVFVYPSLDDGMSNSLLESMAHGLPTVATDIFTDVAVSETTALLVPRFDVMSLVVAVSRILDDTALAKKLGENAQVSMLEHFSPQTESQEYIELFRKLALEWPYSSSKQP